MSEISPSRDVDQLIDHEPVGRFQVRTILLCGCAIVLDGFDAQAIGFLAPAIAEDLGVPIHQFAPIFSAGLLGLMLGSLIFGPLADKVGRRWTVIGSTFVFGLLTFLTASAKSLEMLMVLRFLTGLGLGGALPNLIALATEYLPKRIQGMVAASLFAGIPAGALAGGLLSTVLLPISGWQAVFHVGGILPMLLAIVFVFLLPESVRFLIAQKASTERVLAIMQRVVPRGVFSPGQPFVSSQKSVKGMPIGRLFTEGRAFGTLLLWITCFMNLLLFYFIISWLPALLRQGGMPLSAGISAATAFSAGGVIGCLLTGRLMKKYNARSVLLADFAAAIILIVLLAFNVTNLAAVMVITTLLGIAVQGAQGGINAWAASSYPTEIRSTGIGWALGIGRIGSTIGPLVGGVALSFQWQLSSIFLISVLPAAIAAIAMLVAIVRRRDTGAGETAVPQGLAH